MKKKVTSTFKMWISLKKTEINYIDLTISSQDEILVIAYYVSKTFCQLNDDFILPECYKYKI